MIFEVVFLCAHIFAVCVEGVCEIQLCAAKRAEVLSLWKALDINAQFQLMNPWHQWFLTLTQWNNFSTNFIMLEQPQARVSAEWTNTIIPFWRQLRSLGIATEASMQKKFIT